MPVAPRFPQRLFAARRPPAEDEQQVREPVQVADHLGVELIAAGDREPLRSPADRAADMQVGRGRGSSRKDERLQRLEGRIDLVAALLEPLGLLGDDPEPLAVRVIRRRDVRADVEQVVLDPFEPRGVLLGQVGHRER